VVTGPVCAGAENLDLPGFDPPTFQPAVSCYADGAIPTPDIKHIIGKYGVNLGTAREWRTFVNRPAGNL
jgi:hypothetical protein